MKNINLKTSILGSLLLTPMLLIGAKNVQASTVATVHSNVQYATLLTHDGYMVKNRALGANTPWLVGKTIKLNSRPYYEVGKNEYVDSQLVDISGNQNDSNNAPAPTKLIGYASKVTYLVNDKGEAVQNRALASNTYWQVGKVIQNKNGQVFYQVATNEYVKKEDMSLNKEPSIETIADFGIKADSSNNNNNQNNNNNDNQSNNNQGNNNNNTNQNNNSNNGNSDYDENNLYVDVDSIDIPTIKTSLVKYINAERAKIGSKPVTEHPYLMSTAQTRSQEAVQNYSHERPNGTLWNTVIDKNKYWKTREGENLVIVTSRIPRYRSENPADLVAKMATEGFKSDALHYGTMTDKYYINVGIGVTLDKANNRFYVVEHFWD